MAQFQLGVDLIAEFPEGKAICSDHKHQYESTFENGKLCNEQRRFRMNRTPDSCGPLFPNSHRRQYRFPLHPLFYLAHTLHFCVSFICEREESRGSIQYNVSFLRPTAEICGQPLFRSPNHFAAQKQIAHAKSGRD